MAGLVDGFNVGRNNVQVGMIQFSGESRIVFKLDRYDKKLDVIEDILKQQRLLSGTYTFKALDQARSTLFQTNNGMR